MLRCTFIFLLAAAALMALPKPASAQVYYGAFGATSMGYFPSGGGFFFATESPRATRDRRIDPCMLKAARIADANAFPHSTLRCWRFVKVALMQSGAVAAYPKTNYACQAGDELTKSYGFVRLPIYDPYRAPLGSVLVYSGGGAGHVEIRTEHGFASDYRSRWHCRYRLIGVYAKFSAQGTIGTEGTEGT
jgi:hypothetical protein